MKSWRTTILGIIAIVMAIATAVKAAITGGGIDVATILAEVSAGIGLITARDHKISSEEAGIKPSLIQ